MGTLRTRIQPASPRPRQRSNSGQALVEFCLVAILLLGLLFGIVDFGILFEDRAALAGAARAGSRYGAVNSSAWSKLQPAPAATIQGQIQAAGGTTGIANAAANIAITYWVPGTGALTQCGSYDYTADAFAASGGYTQATCLIPGNIIRVTLTYRYTMLTPLLSKAFNGGVNISNEADSYIEN